MLIMKYVTVYQQWTTEFIALFVKEFLTELVISRDTSVWQKDLCQSRNSREPLNVWSVIDGFAAGEALLYTSVQLLRGRLEASSLENHVTFMVVERRRRCVCVYVRACMCVCVCHIQTCTHINKLSACVHACVHAGV